MINTLQWFQPEILCREETCSIMHSALINNVMFYLHLIHLATQSSSTIYSVSGYMKSCIFCPINLRLVECDVKCSCNTGFVGLVQCSVSPILPGMFLHICLLQHLISIKHSTSISPDNKHVMGISCVGAGRRWKCAQTPV